jgi:hypothetical protein
MTSSLISGMTTNKLQAELGGTMGVLVFWSLSTGAMIMIIVMVAGASDRNVVKR